MASTSTTRRADAAATNLLPRRAVSFEFDDAAEVSATVVDDDANHRRRDRREREDAQRLRVARDAAARNGHPVRPVVVLHVEVKDAVDARVRARVRLDRG